MFRAFQGLEKLIFFEHYTVLCGSGHETLLCSSFVSLEAVKCWFFFEHYSVLSGSGHETL